MVASRGSKQRGIEIKTIKKIPPLEARPGFVKKLARSAPNGTGIRDKTSK